MPSTKKTAGAAQATLEPPEHQQWPSPPVTGTVSGDAPETTARQGGSQEMETEEIIQHVVFGELTEHNPRLRKISKPFKVYVDGSLARQKEIDKRLAPLRKAVSEFPEEQRKVVYALLDVSNESHMLAHERELMRRAIPLIEAFRQQSRRLRRDRNRAFDFIGRLRAKLQDLEYWGLGPIPEPSEDHWPENQDEDDLREPGGG